MTGHCVFWKAVTVKNVRGEDYASDMADIISSSYRGRLISEIMSMPPKEVISFEAAVRLICEKRMRELKQLEPMGPPLWHYRTFVQFISDCGFHIELIGDEFDVSLKPTENC